MDELYADRSGSIRKNSAHPDELTPPAGGFVVVTLDGRPVGCGGFKRFDDETCEIKRMYLAPELRGRGVGLGLLLALEALGRERGYSVARLDTGDRQPAAKRLYERAGYREIGDYNGNPYAHFWFEKRIPDEPARPEAKDAGGDAASRP